ncbi:MAG: SPFH domain-containing protein [Ruminococcus sp.]|nr:SPFH domain-containing protein [Ruminococcus sp.]
MGLIKAAAGAIGGMLADSWLDFIEADEMGPSTAMVRGVQVDNRRGSNKKGSANYVSNGSRIVVGPNQMMLLVDGGRIADYCAEPGYYEVFFSTAPSMFNGEFKDSLKDTWNRFKFGGQPSSKQEVYFINLQELKGIRFGTRNALNYFDNFYNAELNVRCHGTYSIKITDPLKFFEEACPRNASRVDMNDCGEQYMLEFTQALQNSIAQMSVDGKRISHLNAETLALSRYLADALDDQWKNLRGMEICSVALSTISYDEESKKLINMRNQGAMLSDPTVREGYVQGAVARGLEAAGSNKAGAGQAFMAMGMGMQGAGSFMQSASATNAQQMNQAAQQQVQAQAANGWNCSCGQTGNTGNFCQGCGSKKPTPAASWNCSCGQTGNTGNFCQGCGSKRPAADWKCSCGTTNTGNFCEQCGSKRP